MREQVASLHRRSIGMKLEGILCSTLPLSTGSFGGVDFQEDVAAASIERHCWRTRWIIGPKKEGQALFVVLYIQQL
jgi:hypothetical protein